MLKLDLFEALGDWNPQLLRELQGRLKPRNLILAIATSLIIQFLVLMIFGSRGQDLCLALSIIAIFSLLGFGTGLLISNLAQEERRGTLNFIRLSPRSPQNILWGKMLGVPILLYIAVLLAIPLHLWAGIAANIPLIRILSFYAIVVTSCIFFYSLSLLFSLISSKLNGFQAFLGGGTASLFILMGLYIGLYGDAFDWIKIFSPTVTFRYLILASAIESRLHWFNLPVGMSLLGITSIAILNYSLWTYWIWQAIKRCFVNPSKTTLSKIQSYWFVACFEIVALGFAINTIRYYTGGGDSHRYRPGDNFMVLLVYNFVLFCGLIVILTPQRQALIDWARYRNQKLYNRNLFRSLLKDLVWGENSPAIVAIALNGIITAIILIPWIMLEMDKSDRLPILMALVFNFCLILVCAAISQLVALMQTQKAGFGIIGMLIILPPPILMLLPVKIPVLWLFTIFALTAIKDAGVFGIFLALLGQLTLFTWCSVQFNRQLKKAGVSNSIDLFAPSKVLLP